MKRVRAFLPLLALIAIGIGLIASGSLDRFAPARLATEQVVLRDWIAAHPVTAALMQIGAMTLAISTGIPGAIVIVLAGGMLFGFIAGTLLSSAGCTLGAVILFVASRNAFAAGQGRVPALVEKLRAGYQAYPVSFSLFLRLVPFFPFGGVTVALAWLRCPLWLFTAATAFGGTVMIAFETALGAGLSRSIAREGTVSLDVFTKKGVLLPLLGMAVLALAPIALSGLRKKSERPPP